MTAGMRVLATGSRTWTDWRTLMAALSLVWEPDAVLICGACPRGADDLAARCWRYWGGRVEAWPAQGEQYGRSAGFRRNAAMVAARPDVCLAFVENDSCGASDTVAGAQEAGVSTFIWRREHDQQRRGGVRAARAPPPPDVAGFRTYVCG